MNRLKMSIAVAAALLGGAAHAAPVILTGNYLQVSINDAGHIGQGGANPGLIYDRTGTGNFNRNFDYIAPGVPFEAFGVRVGASGPVYSNSNSGSDGIATVAGPTDTSTGATNSATWSGRVNGLFDIAHSYSFLETDQNIRIQTTITALSDLSDVRFARAADPDPDNNELPGSTASTDNVRGAGTLAPTDFVGSVGQVSGQPLGLFSNSSVTHNTGIVDNCCGVIDPNVYLAGGDYNSSTGDHGIGLAFRIGALTAGQAITLDYFYVTAGSLRDVEVPGGGSGGGGGGGGGGGVGKIPVPGTLALLGLGTVGLAGLRRRKA